MKILFSPVDLISAPNSYSLLSQWSVTQGTAETLALQLQINDALGKRRYIPAAGSTVKLTFMRARSVQLGVVDAAQTFEVSGTAVTDDRSMWTFALTAAQVNTLITGTVKMVLTSGTTVYTYNLAYGIQKTLVSAGC